MVMYAFYVQTLFINLFNPHNYQVSRLNTNEETVR